MARLNARWNNFTQRGQTWDHFWQDEAVPPVVYAATGDVALTFGVAAGFEYVSAGSEKTPPAAAARGGGYGGAPWGKKPRPLKVRRNVYEFTGHVWFAPGWQPRSPWFPAFSPQTSGASMAQMATEARMSMTRNESGSVEKQRLQSASPMQFTVTPQLDEWLIIDPDDWLGAILNEEELALGGVP